MTKIKAKNTTGKVYQLGDIVEHMDVPLQIVDIQGGVLQLKATRAPYYSYPVTIAELEYVVPEEVVEEHVADTPSKEDAYE